jgi:hypothetical protein
VSFLALGALAKARFALSPLFDRGALVSVDAHSAGQLAGDRLVPHLAIVSHEEVTTALQVEIATVLADAGIFNPFLVSHAAP